MIDFASLDKKYEVTYDEHKVAMFAYVWKKSKESDTLENNHHIKLSKAFEKVKNHHWRFYSGDENILSTYIIVGLLNSELGAYETDKTVLFFQNSSANSKLEDVTDTNNIIDTSLREINHARHCVNYLLGFSDKKDFVQGFDYNDSKDFDSLIENLLYQKSRAANLIQNASPTDKELLNRFSS